MVVTEQMKQKALNELEKQKALKQQEEAYASAKGIKDVVGKKNTDFVIVGENKYPLATYGDIQKFEEQMKQKALNELQKLKVLKQQEEAYAGAKGTIEVLGKRKEPNFVIVGENKYPLATYGDIQKFEELIKQGAIELNKQDAEGLVKVKEQAMIDMGLRKQEQVKTTVSPKKDKIKSKAEQEFDEMFDDEYTIDESKVVDKTDDVIDTVSDVAKVVDKTDDIPGAGKISKAAKVTNFLKKNPKIAKILGNKWAKLGGKAVMPVTVAYTALKDFEGFNEGSVDFSGNTFQDIGELAEEGTRSALDMGGKFVLNTAEDAIEIGDTILKGLAWGLGQMGDIGNEATKFFGSDKTREEIKKNEVDYSTLFMKAIDDLGLSDKYKKESNKTKAGLNALLYGKDGFDEDVYQRTLDKYNKKLEPEDELINSNADDSGIELGDITPDSKKGAELVNRDTQPNQLKAEKLKIRDGEAYQDRQVVKNPDGTYKYLSHQTGDYKDTDEVTGEKLTTLDQVKKQIDKGLTQDYAYRANKAGDKTEAKKILDDAKVRGYTEDDIGISIF